jgi:hypothetical protein
MRKLSGNTNGIGFGISGTSLGNGGSPISTDGIEGTYNAFVNAFGNIEYFDFQVSKTKCIRFGLDTFQRRCFNIRRMKHCLR